MSELDRKTFLRLMAAGAASFLGRPLPVLGQTLNPNGQFDVPNQSDQFRNQQLAPMRGSQAIRVNQTRQTIAQPSQTMLSSNSQASWGRLKFPCIDGDWDDWNAHAHGDLNFLKHLNDTTSISISSVDWNVANIDKIEEMTRYPFLFMHAEMPPDLSAQQIANLREYILRGGFLFAEDCVRGKSHHHRGGGPDPDLFFQGIMETMPKVFPEAKIEKLPNDHPVYHCFYHLPNGLPMCQGQPHGGHGVTLNGRLVAFLSPHDNHCGWTHPAWFTNKDPRAGELALQMGTNLYIYAMTQNA
jgi:hypothetical protein